jgi:PAS domain S-box-containing protein
MKSLTDALALAADGAMLVNREGTVVFWNRAAERLLGFRADEVKGRRCHEILRGETIGGNLLCTPSCPIASRVACGRGVRNFDMLTHTKAGRAIWLNVSSFPVPSGKRGQYVAAHMFRDITKHAKVRRMVEDLHAELCSGAVKSNGPVGGHDPPPESPATLPLSEREREILSWAAAGRSNKEIADRLSVSIDTVKSHLHHIYRKLGVTGRVEAILLYYLRAK